MPPPAHTHLVITYGGYKVLTIFPHSGQFQSALAKTVIGSVLQLGLPFASLALFPSLLQELAARALLHGLFTVSFPGGQICNRAQVWENVIFGNHFC